MVFELYTIGAGDIIVNGLNSVALLAKQSSYRDIIIICGIIGLAWAVLAVSIGEKSMADSIKDMLKVSLVLGVMVAPTAKVVVYDRAYGGSTQSLPIGYVDNVPLGLATFASLSFVGHKLTDLFEAAFQRPVLSALNQSENGRVEGMGYLSQYSKYGMVFGSKLIAATTKAKIQDAEFAQDINSYVRECIIYDLSVGKRLKMSQIKESKDLLGLITGQTGEYVPNKALHIHARKDYSDDSSKDSDDDTKHFLRCDKAGAAIYKHWDEEEKKVQGSLSGFLFPSLEHESANTVLSEVLSLNSVSLKNIARGVSNESTSLLKQNMIINAFKSGTNSFVNQGLISSNAYMQARSQMQTRKAYESVFMQAERYLPILRAVLEILLYCLYPLMIMMMVLPNGLNIGGMFFKLFLWLQLWAPTYALINFVMSFNGMLYLKAASKLPDGTQALTMLNQVDIMSTAQDTALMAGTLIGMIPLLTFFLASKSMPIMGNIGASLLGIPQSTASTAAAEVSTGQISLGNTSTQNHSASNVSDNKFNESVVMDTGMVQNRDAQGNMRTMTAIGNSTMQTQYGVSNLTSNLVSNGSLATQLGQNAEKLHSIAESEKAGVDESTAEGWSHGIQVMNRAGITQTSGDSYNKDIAHSQDWALGNVMSVVDEVADRTSLTREEALQATIGFSVPELFNVMGLKGGANLEGKISDTHAEDIIKRFNDTQDFKDSIGILEKSLESKSFAVSDSEGQEHVDQASSSFNKTHTLSESSAKHFDDSRKYAEMSSFTKGRSYSVTSNMNDAAMDYGVNHVTNPDTGQFFTRDEVYNSPDAQREVLQHFIDDKIMQDPEFASNFLKINNAQDDINLNTYESMVANDERFNPETLENRHKIEGSKLTSDYHDAVQGKRVDNSNLKDSVQGQIQQGRERINEDRNKLIEQKQSLEGTGGSEPDNSKSLTKNLMQGKYGDLKEVSGMPSWSKDLKNNNNQSSNS